MKTLLKRLKELLFPPKCIFCRKLLPGGDRLCCESCAAELSGREQCTRGLYVKTRWTALSYEGRVRDMLIRYKFQGFRFYAGELGVILSRCIDRELAGQYDLITWIPVSRKRRRKRGYDQAMLLALRVAEKLNVPVERLLEKPVDNPAQSGLTDSAERRSNVQGVYRAVNLEQIKGKRILLIDDVITTGATMDEAGRILLDAGAKEVTGAALARPPEHKTDNDEGSL